MYLKPKKNLGQHFLNSEKISQDIVNSVNFDLNTNIIEVGPGMGALTKFIIQKANNVTLVELDEDSINFLKFTYPGVEIIHADFLKFTFNKHIQYTVIGNFPYNISSQIVFKIIENRCNILESVGMFQKEVAKRICSKPKSKSYGILSVILQAYYDCHYLFDVEAMHFNPRPKVQSGVVSLVRHTDNLNVKHSSFVHVVKVAFNQRRKKLKNSLKIFSNLDCINLELTLSKRAEELSVSDYINLTKVIFPN
tara:strand:+ start:97 stop:849 length:753 start_codon:yes stop_codon:yes gene_type:complete